MTAAGSPITNVQTPVPSTRTTPVVVNGQTPASTTPTVSTVNRRLPIARISPEVRTASRAANARTTTLKPTKNAPVAYSVAAVVPDSSATRGAKIVFHPSLTGHHRPNGLTLTTFGSEGAPYYEKAMRCRSIENTIYFASVNYAVPFPEAATALIGPTGECEAFLPYGEEGVLVAEMDVTTATGLIASRYAPARYQDIASQ